jgi:hypothetical protein
MARTPNAAPELTEEDFDKIVDEEIRSMPGGSTEDPGNAPADDPSDDEGLQPDTGDAPAQPADGDDIPEDEGSEPAPAAAPSAVVPAAPAAPARAAPPAPAPPAPVPDRPFQYKAMGAEHTLPGATVLADGRLVIAPTAVPDLAKTLASQRELQTNFQKVTRQHAAALEEAKREGSEKIAEAEAMRAYMADLLAMDPDTRYEALQKLEQDMPRLQAEVREKEITKERERLAAERKAFEEERAGPKPTQEEQAKQFVQTVHNELANTYNRLKQDPDAKLLSAEEYNAVFAKHAKKPNRLIVRAEADDEAAGIKKGDYLFDESELIEDLELAVKIKKEAMAAAGASAPPAPTGAAAVNAARNADKPVNVIPPVVPPAAPVNPAPRQGGKKKPMSKAEFRRKFTAGELDDPD